ncbi:hypothetical protein OV203_20380 [Nannocystis sp. ILAH1]|uniref:protein NO VEIN domain-containing protein n=1 Tax=Nannocystis sp. ILAH1 TaxID=2996789 RepID=UPI00226FA4F3|nr:DUF3883 domain-containing protein [Nannocystis sp. ILAH1]MCY0989509.1 hypothetical protein [Nannocystis sp. ILAH1]
MTHYALLWDDPASYDRDRTAAELGRPVTYGWWGASPSTRPGTGDVAWIVVDDADGYPRIGARAGVCRDEHGEVWLSLDDMLPRQRMVGAHWLAQEHYDELASGGETARQLSDRAGRALENLWHSERIGQRLRERLTWHLKHSHMTPSAKLRALKPAEVPVLGSWGGRHEVEASSAWLYTRNNGRLGMLVAVYSNFSNHDTLCVVGEPDTLTSGALPRTGPTLQLNGHELYEQDALGIVHVAHHGLVTVRSRVSRSDLLASIRTTAPIEADRLQLRSLDAWPFPIGSTADLVAFLDRLFEYGYCIEQAKRRLRKDPLLLGPAVDPRDPPPPPPAPGQGHEPDDHVRQIVEDHAMTVAYAELTRMGFAVENVSRQRGTLDLLCRSRTRPTMTLRVEVKGTRGDGSAVLLTAGEVARARAEPDTTALFVVSQIQVAPDGKPFGGTWRLYRPWQIERCELYPTQYRCHLEHLLPDEHGEVQGS